MSSLSLYTNMDDNDYSTLTFSSLTFEPFVIQRIGKKIRKPYNVIFDLDNTLLCSVQFNQLHLIPNNINLQYKDYIFDTTNLGINYRIFLRPYLTSVLKEISKIANISVWTAAQESYADFIVNNIFPKDIKPEFVFTSKETEYGLRQYFRFKPLELVYETFPNEYNSSNTIIIDDLSDVFSSNPKNCIPIHPFKMLTDRLNVFNNTVTTDRSLPELISLIKDKFKYNLK